MQTVTKTFENTLLCEDAYGKPVAVLTRKPGVSDKDLSVFRQAHVPNGVEIRNFAELIEAELDTIETRNRVAEMTKTRKWETTIGTQVLMSYTEHDARVKIVNEIVSRYQNVIRYAVQPRQPQPKPEPGERGRQLAEQAQAASKAATAYPPKIEAMMEKRRKLDAEIEAALDEERPAKIAKAEAERKAAAKEEKGPGLVDRFRAAMAEREKNNPRREEPVAMGLLKG
jgi:hypothetical protein